MAATSRADIANPGAISLHIDGGAFSFAGQDLPFGGDVLPLPDLGLPATVTSDGTLTIPAGGFELPPFDLDVSGIPIAIGVSTTDLTGSIDPASGAADLDLTLVLQVTVSDLSALPIELPFPLPAGLAITCDLSPTIALSTAHADGVPYDVADGTATLAADELTLPPATGADPISGFVCPLASELITSQLGTAIPAFGLRLDVRTDPVLQPVVPAGVRGTVTDHGRGVRGLVVEALPTAGGTAPSTTTRRNGTYAFSDLPLGAYRVRVSDPALGYATTWVGGDRRADARIFMLASGSSLIGNARVRGTGVISGLVVSRRDRPLADLHVALHRDGRPFARTRTGGRGGFTIPDLGPGEYELHVYDPAKVFGGAWYLMRRTGDRLIPLDPGQHRTVRMVLQRR